MKLTKFFLQAVIAPVLVGIGEKVGETVGEMLSERINPTPWRCTQCGETGKGDPGNHECPEDTEADAETDEDESATD